MEEFGPGHKDHRKVPWLPQFEETSILLPSTFIGLLRCNSPPSVEEVRQVKDYQDSVTRSILENGQEVIGLKNEVIRLQEEIQRLQNRIIQQITERRSLYKQAFACEVILSPFRRLPADIIYHIAMIADCHQQETPCNPATRSPPHIPTLFTHVSRPLRGIVLGVPNLWNRIDVRWRCAYPTDPRKLFEKVKHFSALSGTLPLSIHLDESDFQHPREKLVRTVQPVPYLLQQIISSDLVDNRRIVKLSLTSPKHRELKSSVKKLILCEDNILPNLVTLAFGYSSYDDGSCSSGKFFTEALEKLPKLQKFSSGEPVLDVEDIVRSSLLSTATLLQHWCKLSALHLRCDIRRNDWLMLLRACPNIEFGWFAMASPREEFDVANLSAETTFTHPHLRELCILFQDFTEHLFIFSGLQFTHLVALRLQFRDAELQSPGERSAAARHIEKAFPSLQHVVLVNIIGICHKFKYIFPLFLAVPSTTSLSISATYDTALDLLTLLQQTYNERPILPNLKALTLTFSPRSPLSWSLSGRPSGDRLEVAIIDTHLSRNVAQNATSGISTTLVTNARLPFFTEIEFIALGSEPITKGPWHGRMTQYFHSLQAKFQTENINISVRTREEFVLDWDVRYFSRDVMHYFDP
ncbi:hypothetical protein BJ165DRAFT_1491867 [Panaeolus papilionaceus]|nr:hypothetical protein BJ165DRAFT_1491867 [Panaeolus papilionaceus]